MKKIMAMLLILAVLGLAGCGTEGELDGVDDIKKEDIFAQEESKYYVYFHRIDCADCEEADPNVISYSSIIENVEDCATKRKIYAVLLYTASEKPGEDTYIYREYEGSDGQGTDGKYFVDGVTEWDDLYIGTTASLISISTNSVTGVKTAKYVAQGSEAILQELNAQLGTCYS
ncbi:MAG TPA: hypothetical protein DD618_03585 [Acholeplasmatales bacterium]|nr:hypothetical protein [Acholeplasmatales bacterium]